MIGTTISHYKILEKLDGRGMGVVSKEENARLKRMARISRKAEPFFNTLRSDERLAALLKKTGLEK